MERLLIVNGSPRAPKSNSRQYAAIFRSFCSAPVDEYEVTAKKHGEICAALGQYSDILLVFPLYVDSLPVPLMDFLKGIAAAPCPRRPKIHVLVNCGFLEPQQNDTAIEMIRLFCRRYGFAQGMALSIGSGEAILATPFAFLARRGIKKLARRMEKGGCATLRVAMSLTARAYIRASTGYWLRYGAQFGCGRQEMETMQIEGR